MPVKTDRTDARAIAQMVRTGWFRGGACEVGALPGTPGAADGRKLPVGKLRDIDNGIRGMLRGFGLKVGPVGERAFPTRTRELAADRRSLAAVIEPLLQVREALLCQRDRLHRLVVAATRDDEVCRRLMTVPGRRPGDGAHFLLGRRRPGPVQPVARGGRPLRPYATALPVRRDRPCRSDQQAGRRPGAAGALRGGQRPADPNEPLVVVQGLGHGDR